MPNTAIDSYRRVDKMDGGKEAICLYFDYRNAFDSVPRMRQADKRGSGVVCECTVATYLKILLLLRSI